LSRYDRSAAHASAVGTRMAKQRIEAAKKSVWRLVEERAKHELAGTSLLSDKNTDF